MKRILCFLVLLSLPLYSIAQEQSLSSRLLNAETKAAAAYINVYVNGSTIGTVSDEHGRFTLKQIPEQAEIVISGIGYELRSFQYAELKKQSPEIILLKPKKERIAAIKIKQKRSKVWYENYEIFKKNFLGIGKFSSKCSIENPEALIIRYNPKENVMEVEATEILQIKNKALGYKIHYHLLAYKHFFKTGQLFYEGYSFFEALNKRRTPKAVAKKREQAYSGSMMHFIRSMCKHNLKAEGFDVHQLVRKPNPDYPSDEERKYLRALLMLTQRDSIMEDSLQKIMRNLKKPKQVNYLYSGELAYSHFLEEKDDKYKLSFPDYLHVEYIKEKEELAFVNSSPRKNKNLNNQTSTLSLLKQGIEIFPNGHVNGGVQILCEGYMGWEKLAYMLPLDYEME